jgi:hypothetical protein
MTNSKKKAITLGALLLSTTLLWLVAVVDIKSVVVVVVLVDTGVP